MKAGLVIAVLAVFVSSATAAPMCLAGETLASYIALEDTGCQIDDKVFAGFTYSLTNFSQGGPTPDDIFVIPITTPFNPGLIFLPRVPWRGVGGLPRRR